MKKASFAKRAALAGTLLLGSLPLGLAASAGDAQAFVWPNVPQRIARALASTDPSERRTAVHQIHELPVELAEPLVKKALADSDVEVRIEAGTIAAEFKIKGLGDTVVPWLAETDPRLRLAACQVINSSPTPESIQALGRVLADQSMQVRLAAAHAMGASQSPDSVSPLLGHLDDQAPEVRSEVASALGRLGNSHAVLPLVGKIRDNSPDVRRRVARSLGELGDTRAVSALVLALSDNNIEVRLEAVRALGLLGSDDATTALTPLGEGVSDGANELNGSSPPATEASLSIRQAALDSLGRIATPRAISVLVRALERDNADAQRTPAQDALVRVGQAAVRPLLDHLEAAPSPGSATGAVLALGAIGDVSAVDPIVKSMQRGLVSNVSALRALGLLKSPGALPAVLELIDDPDPKVRSAAVNAASALLDPKQPDGRAVEPIRAALENARGILERVQLVELLGRTGAARVEPVLLGLTTVKSVALKRAAIEALGTLRAPSKKTDDALIAALDDADINVRGDAAIALSRSGTGEAAPELLKRLVESAEQDRGALALAVSGVFSRSTSDDVAKRAGTAVKSASNTSRDALIEGIGRMQTAGALVALQEIAKGGAADRRKVAEASSPRKDSLGMLLDLAKDADPSVRATAVWSLGRVVQNLGGTAKAEALAATVSLLTDPDVSVASNAAGALSRMAPLVTDAKAVETSLRDPLCKAVADSRSYVRANSLSALADAKLTCDAKVVLPVLQSDGSEVVRVAAVRVLTTMASDPLVKRALARCASDDPSATVADACEQTGAATSPASPKPLATSRPRATSGGGTFDMTIFVVPDGRDLPVSEAPFTLVLPGGLLRTGTSDRRGAFFESGIPEGTVELGVPAALAP